MPAYYNENDLFVAEWLGSLSDRELVAPGLVDARDIREVEPSDVVGTQAHFFAGIGGWSLALRLAGWPDDASVWTGSCPCQPFSQAGRRKGVNDDRHLWPEWRRLIAECRPSTIFGEQVASPDGRAWLAAVRADLEDLGYEVGAADLCAAGVGAPHIRQRLYFVAVAGGERREGLGVRLQPGQPRSAGAEAARGGASRDVADTVSGGRKARELQGSEEDSQRCAGASVADNSEAVGVGNADGGRGPRDAGAVPLAQAESALEGVAAWRLADESLVAGAAPSAWGGAEWLYCRDGKFRPAQPGAFPLAHGVPARVGRVRAYGNAIVPQVAAVFVTAAVEALRARRALRVR